MYRLSAWLQPDGYDGRHRGEGCGGFGQVFPRKEMTNPTRIVTSAVRVENGCAPMVSCKTEADIPKSIIFDVTAALAGLRVAAPVHIGDVILQDAAGTGVDIVATKNVEAAV